MQRAALCHEAVLEGSGEGTFTLRFQLKEDVARRVGEESEPQVEGTACTETQRGHACSLQLLGPDSVSHHLRSSWDRLSRQLMAQALVPHPLGLNHVLH